MYLSFNYLSYSFSKIYWNLASKYNIPQIHNGRESAMVKAFKKVKDTYPDVVFDGVDFDVLSEQYKSEYLKLTKKQIKLDVLFALFSDFNENIYGYNEMKEYIYFSKRTYGFLLEYKDALEKIDYYSWIRWTENILSLANKNVSNLSEKLDEAPSRIALERFKKELLSKGDDLKCFYCGKSLADETIHLDHFVPWSFVKDNKSWNFVFSCAHCNESKNNKIPNKDFLKKLISRNEKLFNNSYQINLSNSYNAALHNGFVIWEKKFK